MKRIVSFILILVVLCSFSSCGEKDNSFVNKNSKIAVAENSNELSAASRYCEENGGEIVKYSDVYDAVTAVENGVVDCVMLDEFTASAVINNGASLEFYANSSFSIKYCAYFTEENKALCDEFNRVIKEMTEEGIIEDIKDCHKSGGVYEIDMADVTGGEITMLCDPVFENIIYYDETGEISGVDLDIAKVAFSRLGYNLKIKAVSFEDLFFSLEDGEGDVVLSGMEYKKERDTEYYASDTYNSMEFALYKRA